MNVVVQNIKNNVLSSTIIQHHHGLYYLVILLIVLCSHHSDAFSPQYQYTAIHTLPSFSPPFRVPALHVLSMDQNNEVEVIQNKDNHENHDNHDNVTHTLNPESASLLPGQILTIRIGDTSLARKAWKKRRRSGSPMLVPCTITSINRGSMVKNNIINLIHRFGKTNNKGKGLGSAPGGGVVITVGAMVKLYKHRLGGNLLQHCQALGYDTIVSYLKDTFDGHSVKDCGISLLRMDMGRNSAVSASASAGSGSDGKKRGELVLASTLSLRLAREAAYKAEFVQFMTSNNSNDSDDDADHSTKMIHSGTTFQLPSDKDKYQTISTLPSTYIQPLSAAVRIAHADEISTRITTGLECNAFVHSYEIEGDNGSPLLICSIDPPREQIRDQMKRRAYVRRQMNNDSDNNKSTNNSDRMLIHRRLDGRSTNDSGNYHNLKDLKNGDGPFQAIVVHVSDRAGAAFVDFGVSREKGKKQGGGVARVLGMLRFDDANDTSDHNNNDHDDSSFEALIGSSECSGEEAALVEDSIRKGLEQYEDEEQQITIEEDVSTMYSMDENGDISFIDPETQEVTMIGSIDEDIEEFEDEEKDDDDDGDDLFAGMSPEERLTAIGNMLTEDEGELSITNIKDNNNSNRRSLAVGDEVEVYIQAVFPQSGRFMVTTNNNAKKIKEIKQEREAEKRLERLVAKLGGKDGLALIQSFVGKDIEGTIKAVSKAGDWYYVQPSIDTGLPVGIGSCDCLKESLEAGDRVLISVDGIDYKRGQLSLKVIKKI